MLVTLSREGVVFLVFLSSLHFTEIHVLPSPVSEANWRFLFRPGGLPPTLFKMASSFTGSAHPPFPGYDTVRKVVNTLRPHLFLPSFPFSIFSLFHNVNNMKIFGSCDWSAGKLSLFLFILCLKVLLALWQEDSGGGRSQRQGGPWDKSRETLYCSIGRHCIAVLGDIVLQYWETLCCSIGRHCIAVLGDIVMQY